MEYFITKKWKSGCMTNIVTLYFVIVNIGILSIILVTFYFIILFFLLVTDFNLEW